ncbi:MAG TPA: PLP-dependent cysteine synthase family protein [Candidatus Saccharimonadales bacterium]|nr:PLP-dependent cysteine synthase family protein [Candidatus Saccharimonadales bacterium]
MTTTLEVPTSKFKALTRLIGNTPLISIHFRYHGTHRLLFAKSEYLNLTGSIKDRMALCILQKAYAEGKIQHGYTIAEATSGNTGISFAAIGRMLGHPVKIFMPDWMSQERVHLIRSYGAEVVSVSKSDGGFLGSIKMCEEFAASRKDVFLPRQFSNPANIETHEQTTGPEIWSQFVTVGKRPKAFVAGVGTGGTVMGVGRFLKRHDSGIRVHPVEPAESPTLSTGCKVGNHRIQGISDEFVPEIMNLKEVDEVLKVHDGDAILMAQKLATELGLAVGISSGCNFLAAIEAQEKLSPDAAVVTVFCDDNKKYLSTCLTNEEPARPEYLSPNVELLGLGTVGRACEFCH